MRTVVVGAGPTGLFTAIALARRGREVVVVDRDPGPPPSGRMIVWQRKGVMQFHHAHTFRGPVIEELRAEMPDVLDALVAAGATIATTAENRSSRRSRSALSPCSSAICSEFSRVRTRLKRKSAS